MKYIRIPDELYVQLQAKAKEEERSAQKTLERILRKELTIPVNLTYKWRVLNEPKQ